LTGGVKKARFFIRLLGSSFFGFGVKLLLFVGGFACDNLSFGFYDSVLARVLFCSIQPTVDLKGESVEGAGFRLCHKKNNNRKRFSRE
jgi:hypothetical protein